MGTTDNAFIKAYCGRTYQRSSGGRQAVGRDDELGESIVALGDTPHSSFSTPSHPAPRVNEEPAFRQFGAQASSKHVEPQVRADGGLSDRHVVKPIILRDDPHDRVAGPHVRVERFTGGPAIQPFTPSTPLPMGVLPRSLSATPAFTAGWEVDAFSWPSVCNELQKHWVGPLTSVVRAIVRQAWQGGNVVAVTQAARSEGATTLSICLSRIAAAFQLPVALFDGCIHHPCVASSLKLQFELGWDQTSPATPLEELAVRSIQDPLVVVPCSSDIDAQRALPTAALRASVLNRLAATFELVVLDMGPMYLAAREWLQPEFARLVGCALVVRDVRRTEQAQTEDVCHRLREAGVQNVSVIENFQVA